jgi:ribosomal protein S14
MSGFLVGVGGEAANTNQKNFSGRRSRRAAIGYRSIGYFQRSPATRLGRLHLRVVAHHAPLPPR